MSGGEVSLREAAKLARAGRGGEVEGEGVDVASVALRFLRGAATVLRMYDDLVTTPNATRAES